MSKKILIDALTGGDKFATKREAERAIDLVTSGIATLTEGGEKIHIRGFGNFEVKDRKGRTGNLNGNPITIPAKRVLAFADRR